MGPFFEGWISADFHKTSNRLQVRRPHFQTPFLRRRPPLEHNIANTCPIEVRLARKKCMLPCHNSEVVLQNAANTRVEFNCRLGGQKGRFPGRKKRIAGIRRSGRFSHVRKWARFSKAGFRRISTKLQIAHSTQLEGSNPQSEGAYGKSVFSPPDPGTAPPENRKPKMGWFSKGWETDFPSRGFRAFEKRAHCANPLCVTLSQQPHIAQTPCV